MYVNTGREDEIYNKLKGVKNLIVYKKEDMDPAFHYKNNRRIMPLIVSAVEGYHLCRNVAACNSHKMGKNYNFMCQFNLWRREYAPAILCGQTSHIRELCQCGETC